MFQICRACFFKPIQNNHILFNIYNASVPNFTCVPGNVRAIIGEPINNTVKKEAICGGIIYGAVKWVPERFFFLNP